MGSYPQFHRHNMVRARMAHMLGASPSRLIHSVAVRYSQI